MNNKEKRKHNTCGGGETSKEHDKHIINIAKLNSILLALVVVMAFGIGQLGNVDISNADVGTLNTSTGVWYGDSADNGATITVGKAGKYYLQAKGGRGVSITYVVSYGVTNTVYGAVAGNLTGVMNLEVGDVISVSTYNGGSGPDDATDGGKAIMLFVNGEPVIGAGGSGGVASRASDNYYAGVPVSKIDNTTFSAGGGGAYYAEKSKYRAGGGAGSTMTGCTPAPGGAIQSYNGGTPGSNYLDTSKCDLIEQTNDSTELGFKVWYCKQTAEDNPETFNRMAAALETLAGAGSGIQAPTYADILTATVGKQFDELITVTNDTTVGGTSGNIQIINNNQLDGVVRIKGKIDTVGTYQVVIDGVIYSIKIIDEPTSANITAIF